MSKKKGQLTLFVIVAVVIVVAMALFFVLRDDVVFGDMEEKVFLSDSLVGCFEDGFKGGLNSFGQYGGSENMSLLYYYYLGDVRILSLEDVEKILSERAELSVLNCLLFYNDSYDDVFLRYDDFVVDVSVGYGFVDFVVDLDLYVDGENSTKFVEFKESPIVVDSRLREMYDIAEFFVNSLRDNGEWIPLSQVVSMSEEYGLSFNYEEFLGESDVVVSISSDAEGYYPGELNFNNKFRYDFPDEFGVFYD